MAFQLLNHVGRLDDVWKFDMYIEEESTWAMKKSFIFCLLYIGDDFTRVKKGLNISRYKGPYSTSSTIQSRKTNFKVHQVSRKELTDSFATID